MNKGLYAAAAVCLAMTLISIDGCRRSKHHLEEARREANADQYTVGFIAGVRAAGEAYENALHVVVGADAVLRLNREAPVVIRTHEAEEADEEMPAPQLEPEFESPSSRKGA